MTHSLIKLILRQISTEGAGHSSRSNNEERMIHKNLIDYSQSDKMKKMNLSMIPNKENIVFK